MSGDGWGSSFKLDPTVIRGFTPDDIALLEGEKLQPKKLYTALDQIADEKFKYGKKHNEVPTHDPYTNLNAQLYYSCNCGAILDPGTKRFAELNNCASKAGWKIRFTDTGYVPYCVECGKGVE